MEPRIFDGKDKKKLEIWLVKIMRRLKADADYYDSVDPTLTIDYVVGYWEGIAVEAVYPRLPRWKTPSSLPRRPRSP